MNTSDIKGIGSILGLKKNCRKNDKNYLRSNNYEVCTAVAHCFPNILDAIVLENIKKLTHNMPFLAYQNCKK
jgi:hypothetical protein